MTFLYVIYLCYNLVLLFGPNEKTCVHIENRSLKCHFYVVSNKILLS